jgi:hypothetical protein
MSTRVKRFKPENINHSDTLPMPPIKNNYCNLMMRKKETNRMSMDLMMKKNTLVSKKLMVQKRKTRRRTMVNLET